jgi:hypothetical protein
VVHRPAPQQSSGRSVGCDGSGYLLILLLHCCLVLLRRCRYIKFDTYHPAVDKGLPVTRVISRITLQVTSSSSSTAAIRPGV